MGEAFKDFMRYLRYLSELRRDKGTMANISDLESLLRNKRINNNSDTLTYRIVRTLMYGNSENLKTDRKSRKLERRWGEFPKIKRNKEIPRDAIQTQKDGNYTKVRDSRKGANSFFTVERNDLFRRWGILWILRRFRTE